MNRRTLWALTIGAALSVFLCIPSVVSADSAQTWTLSGVTTSDGATASGSFDYNAGTGLYSDIDIVTLAGLVLPGSTYTVVDADDFSPSALVIMANNSYAAGTAVLDIEFGADLTGAGGEVGLFALEGYCNAGCTNFEPDAPGRELEGAVVSPEPSSLLLLGTGLLGLAPLRRKLIAR
jgi:PEP-CTERM motif-containing protein